MSLMGRAYLWHIFCDGVAGGVPYLFPLKAGVIGDHYLPIWTWLVFDAFFVISAAILFTLDRLRRFKAS